MRACLSACPSCHRHVRSSERPCPFCGAPIPAAARRPEPARRLSRPGMLAFGAAVALGLGCGSATDPDVEDTGVAMTDSGPGGIDAGPGEADAGPGSDDAGFDAGFDAGNVAMPYGAPPLTDAIV